VPQHSPRRVQRRQNEVQQWPQHRPRHLRFDPSPIPTPQYLSGQTGHPSVASPNH
jgi:hypothetical protein